MKMEEQKKDFIENKPLTEDLPMQEKRIPLVDSLPVFLFL